MQQKFCHHCGKQAPVAIAKFCSHCGTSFASLSSTPEVKAAPRQQQQSFEPFSPVSEDDDSYIDNAPSLAHILKGRRVRTLDVDIQKDNSNTKETIGSWQAQGKIDPIPLDSRPSIYSNMDEKAFLADFQKEAGTFKKD